VQGNGNIFVQPQGSGAVFTVEPNNGIALRVTDPSGAQQVFQVDGVNKRTIIGLGDGTGHFTANGVSNTDTEGLVTCAASTVTKTFAQAFTSTPTIVVSDETTAGGARVSAKSASAFTVTCTGATDVVDYFVFGNPN
jgi:hypothetical protein